VYKATWIRDEGIGVGGEAHQEDGPLNARVFLLRGH